jgi:hypothetical protein
MFVKSGACVFRSLTVGYGILSVHAGAQRLGIARSEVPADKPLFFHLPYTVWHEHTQCIRSLCSDGNGCLLCIGRPSPFVHSYIRILLYPRVCLRFPSRCMAVRTGRTDLVWYCREKVVVSSETAGIDMRSSPTQMKTHQPIRRFAPRDMKPTLLGIVTDYLPRSDSADASQRHA